MSAPVVFTVTAIKGLRVACPEMHPVRSRIGGALPAVFERGALAVDVTVQLHEGQLITLRLTDPGVGHAWQHALNLAGQTLAHYLKRAQSALPFRRGTLAALALGSLAFLWSGRDGGDSTQNLSAAARGLESRESREQGSSFPLDEHRAPGGSLR